MGGPLPHFPTFLCVFFKKNQGENGGGGGLIKSAGNNKSRPFVRNHLMHHRRRIFKFFFPFPALALLVPFCSDSGTLSMHRLRRENQKMRLGSWALHLSTYFMNAKVIVRGFPLHSDEKQMRHIRLFFMSHMQGNEDECKKIPCGKKRARIFFFRCRSRFPTLSLSRGYSVIY